MTSYRPSGTGVGYGSQDSNDTPSIARVLYDAPAMMSHPRVIHTMGVYKGGIAGAKFILKGASSLEVGEFALSELKRFWKRGLGEAQQSYEFGRGASEITYEEEDGLLRLSHLRAFLPTDCRVLLRDGAYVGVRIRGAKSGDGQNRDLWGPGALPAKGFWMSHNRRYSRWYGWPRLFGMWRPWRRLAGKDGAEDTVDGAFFRFGFSPPIGRYPNDDKMPNARTYGAGQTTDWRRNSDLMREMLEAITARGLVALSSERDEKGEYKWGVDWPTGSLDGSGMLEYTGTLEDAISLGGGVPPEIVEASETGSGYSGRQIPLEAFLAGQQRNAEEAVEAWQRQIGDPLLLWNFGPDAWAVVEVEDLLESRLRQQGGTPGKEAPGQPGQPQPQGGAPKPPEEPKGAQQFATGASSGAGHWVTLENDQHVWIGGDGSFHPKGPPRGEGGNAKAAFHNLKGIAKASKASKANPKPSEGGTDGRRTGGAGASGQSAKTSGPVAQATGGPGSPGASGGGDAASKPAGDKTARSVPADIGEVNKRLDRFESFFRAKGQDQVADWMGDLRDHINEVGTEESLRALGKDRGAGDGKQVQYGGINTEDSPNWASSGDFIASYLDRAGITPLVGQRPDKDVPVIHSQTNDDPFKGKRGKKAIDFQPVGPAYDDKLQESKDLPGLESTEDIAEVMGRKITHLTPDVSAKMDEKYGKDQWIIKTYGDYAFAGQGIFFPQRIAQISQDARNTIWAAGAEVAKHGFALDRNKDGKVIGLKHENGDRYEFGSKEYEKTIDGDVRQWGDKAAAAAANEKGAELPFSGKDFMVQPAFAAVGVSDQDRKDGTTIAPGEGRVHLVVRNGKAEVIPHATWIKGESLPVVFENDDTRAMARAAQDAIDKLPEAARAGQIYAPDVLKTVDGYKVVELNASVEYGGSGYLSDNPLVIDSFVSHLTDREPAHVRFIRKLLSDRKKSKGREGEQFSTGWDESKVKRDAIGEFAKKGESPVKIRTPEEAAAWGKGHFRKIIDSLTADERESLEAYGQGTFIGINGSLRNGHKGGFDGDIKSLDSVMAKSKTPESVVVYRGVKAEVLDGLAEGDVFRDPGYLSTSLRPEVAKFFREENMDGMTLAIKVPAGSHGIYLDAGARDDHDQAEFVLPRKSRLKIVRRDGSHVVAVLLPNRKLRRRAKDA